MKTRLILFVCCMCAPIVAMAGENWPGWRGPTGMGQSDEKDLPLTWGGKNHDNILWKAPLFDNIDNIRRDQNQSSPIVWGQRVFVTVSFWPKDVVAEKEYPEHHVLCFRVKDGQKLWDVKVAPGPWKFKDLRGGYTAPTPASDGERVYVRFGSSVLAALDMNGKEVWRKEIAPFDFDVAIGASPVVYKDRVLLTCDHIKQKKNSSLMSFDAKTGALKWTKPRDVDWAHSTPALATINGKTQLLMETANGPQGLDPDTGDILWSFPTKDRTGDTVTPVYGGGVVYVDSGRGGGLSGGGLAVVPAQGGEIKWKIPGVPAGFSSPVIVGDKMFRLHDPGVMSVWNLASGGEILKQRLEGIDTAVSPVATADGRIYCASAGKSYVLKLGGAKLEILGISDLGDSSRASPAFAGSKIFVKGGRFLFCIGKK
jgi:outer membrane protein assembly factor BamB